MARILDSSKSKREPSKTKSLRSEYPRDLAVRILVRVLTGHEPLDEALASVALKFPNVPHAWLQEVCSGTLRWKGRLDGILDSVAMKKKPSGWLRKILLVAAYQLVVQDRSPPGAVVSETVDEVRSKEGDAPAKFANACLRKISEHAAAFRNQPFQTSFDEKSAAQWASMPVWLWNKLYYQFGAEWASQFALAALDRPTLWIVSKNTKWNQPDWALPGPILGSWQVIEGGQIQDRHGFADGEFLVQDISSQYLVAEVGARVRVKALGPNLTALDLCAAPGGKSVNLAWSGFQVTATDRTESRIPRLRETITRTHADVTILDWKEVLTCEKKNLVWVDAPCSGSGIIRRHPDVRWLKEEKDLIALTKTQRELILQGWEKVLPGGYLVYSVCSVLKEEGPYAVAAVGLKEFVETEWLLCPQSAPHGDGFWAVLLRKPR